MTTCKLIIQDEVNIKLEGLPVEIRRKISNKLKFYDPKAKYTPHYRLGRWDGSINFFGIGGTGYLNHLDIILEILESANITVSEIQDLRQPIDISFNQIDENYWGDTKWPENHPFAGEPIRLREHQVDAINNFLENPQGLGELATSSGKTIITATLSHICEKHGRSLVIVPNKSLVTQTEADYKNCGLDVGVYFGDRKDLNKTHTICTWQSLESLDKQNKKDPDSLKLEEFLKNVKTLIVDECHQASAAILRKLLTKHIQNAPIRWGLTGTVPKEDYQFQSILSSIGPVITKVTAKELQDKGIISNCHIHMLQLLDIPEFKNYQEELKFLTTDEKRLKFIAHKINEIKESGNTLVLVDRIACGEKLHEELEDSVFIKGNIKVSDRETAFKDINQKNNSILIGTYGVAAVGINIVRLYNIVLLEPGKSFVRVIQSIGRGLRKGYDKDFVNIWDISSSCKFSKRHMNKRKKFYKEAEYKYSMKKVDPDIYNL